MKSTRSIGKRGNLAVIQGIALTLGVTAVTLAIVLTMIGTMYTNMANAVTPNTSVGNTVALAAVGNLTTAVTDVVDWVPIIVTVMVGVGILGLLFAITKFGGSNKGGF